MLDIDEMIREGKYTNSMMYKKCIKPKLGYKKCISKMKYYKSFILFITINNLLYLGQNFYKLRRKKLMSMDENK